MNDTQLNFKACIENLEKLNKEYIQANRIILEKTGLPTPIPITSSVLVGSSIHITLATDAIINDYMRLCRIYCIMLWTYWSALKIKSSALEELRLVRHCLVHHEGDIARYSNAPKPWNAEGISLDNISKGKTYVQGYSLMISGTDLIYFTKLIKNEFFAQTGISL